MNLMSNSWVEFLTEPCLRRSGMYCEYQGPLVRSLPLYRDVFQKSVQRGLRGSVSVPSTQFIFTDASDHRRKSDKGKSFAWKIVSNNFSQDGGDDSVRSEILNEFLLVDVSQALFGPTVLIFQEAHGIYDELKFNWWDWGDELRQAGLINLFGDYGNDSWVVDG